MHQFIRQLACLALFATICTLPSGVARSEESTLYVGTYTRSTESRGIYVYQFNDADGSLRPLSVAEGVENPSFLAIHPNQKYLYSADEVDEFNGQNEGAVSAWAIDASSGALTLINRQGAAALDRVISSSIRPGETCWWPATAAAPSRSCRSTPKADSSPR